MHMVYGCSGKEEANCWPPFLWFKNRTGFQGAESKNQQIQGAQSGAKYILSKEPTEMRKAGED